MIMTNMQIKIETERQILFLKDSFQKLLSEKLNLLRVTAPLIVRSDTGINDDLSGIERPIKFTTKDGKINCDIVQSLAKWKRIKVTEYDMAPETGIHTDMNALRIDETLDEIHSIYVDQWDYEIVIDPDNRNVEYLKNTVSKIYSIIYTIGQEVEVKYNIKNTLPREIYFIHSEELYDMYPNISAKQREDKICEKYGAVFIIGIGANIRDTGEKHDNRSSDYDSWCDLTDHINGYHGLNGDILVWNTILGRSYELSSMGIRVNAETLQKQLILSHNEDRTELYYHKKILNGELKQTLGGGIGISRLAMFYLHKKHIGEVQSSVWTQQIINECCEKGINLL